MNKLSYGIAAGVFLLLSGAAQVLAAERCLFDEDSGFAGKLFRAFDGGAAAVTNGNSFSGNLHLAVTPGTRGCELFYDRAFIWEYAIAEKPVPGEFRYAMFAWKKTGGNTIQLGFRDDRSDLVLTYYAGEKAEHKVRSNMKYIQVADTVPGKWIIVIRDMYTDLQGSQSNLLINGIYFIAGDGQSADYDSIYLSDSREALEQLAAKIKEGMTK